MSFSSDVLNFMRTINMIISFLNIILSSIWIAQNRFKWRYSVPTLLFSIHSFVFYVFVRLYLKGLFIQPYNDFFIDWSILLRFQVLASITMMLALLINWGKIWKLVNNG